jgi:hypothetical protein
MTPLARLLIGNAAVLGGAWLWFEIPLANWWQVAANALLAAAVVAGAAWLYGRALAAIVLSIAAWIWIADGTMSRTAMAWVAAAALFLIALAWAARRRGALRSARYWVRGAALVAAGALAPWALVWWSPALGGLWAETASAVVRLGAAYGLANWSYARLRAELA